MSNVIPFPGATRRQPPENAIELRELRDGLWAVCLRLGGVIGKFPHQQAIEVALAHQEHRNLPIVSVPLPSGDAA